MGDLEDYKLKKWLLQRTANEILVFFHYLLNLYTTLFTYLKEILLILIIPSRIYEYF